MPQLDFTDLHRELTRRDAPSDGGQLTPAQVPAVLAPRGPNAFQRTNRALARFVKRAWWLATMPFYFIAAYGLFLLDAGAGIRSRSEMDDAHWVFGMLFGVIALPGLPLMALVVAANRLHDRYGDRVREFLFGPKDAQ